MTTPTSTIFLTGLTGFLGGCLRRRVAVSPRGWGWRALVRRPDGAPPDAGQGFRLIPGDFTSDGEWRMALQGADTVLHMGALTGKARREDHFASNLEGTRRLVNAACEAGVRRFLFVSSVAAGFTDLAHYPYGAAKKAAEEVVLASGLDVLILRPTLIGGRGAPVLEALRRLARLPLLPLFGGGKARVQPIDGDDLADVLLDCLAGSRFSGETLAVGGPERLTMAALLRRFAGMLKGKPPRGVPIPFSLAALPLRGLEALLGGARLPLTEGQLMSFVQDGVAENPSWVEPLVNKDVEAMLSEACNER